LGYWQDLDLKCLMRLGAEGGGISVDSTVWVRVVTDSGAREPILDVYGRNILILLLLDVTKVQWILLHSLIIQLAAIFFVAPISCGEVV
jgi:hypothetical protein